MILDKEAFRYVLIDICSQINEVCLINIETFLALAAISFGR